MLSCFSFLRERGAAKVSHYMMIRTWLSIWIAELNEFNSLKMLLSWSVFAYTPKREVRSSGGSPHRCEDAFRRVA